MLQSVKALCGGAIVARDERFGFVVDLYFDDMTWLLRYIVLDTGRPMPQRSVLIDPQAIERIEPTDGSIHVRLTRREIDKLPDWKSALPVYLQHDMTPMGHGGDDHLRSSGVILGYSVHAPDRSLGHVADLLLETQSQAIAKLEVAAHHWLPGQRVLVSPLDVQSIDRAERKVYLRSSAGPLPSPSSGTQVTH
jgi:hypothetical protein